MTNEEYDRLSDADKKAWHAAHPDAKAPPPAKTGPADLEHLRILLDVEERIRAHGSAFTAIQGWVGDQLKELNDGFVKVQADKIAARQKAESEVAHKDAVAQREAHAKQQEELLRQADLRRAQRELPLVDPPVVRHNPPQPGMPTGPAGNPLVHAKDPADPVPPIYPNNSGVDEAPARRI